MDKSAENKQKYRDDWWMKSEKEGKAEWLEMLQRLRLTCWALQQWDCGCKMGGADTGYGMKQLETEGENAHMGKCRLTQMLTPCQLSFSVPIFRVITYSPVGDNRRGRCAMNFWKLELDNKIQRPTIIDMFQRLAAKDLLSQLICKMEIQYLARLQNISSCWQQNSF